MTLAQESKLVLVTVVVVAMFLAIVGCFRAPRPMAEISVERGSSTDLFFQDLGGFMATTEDSDDVYVILIHDGEQFIYRVGKDAHLHYLPGMEMKNIDSGAVLAYKEGG